MREFFSIHGSTGDNNFNISSSLGHFNQNSEQHIRV
jgi:hypothetical protein